MASIIVYHISVVFLPNLLCVSEVTNDVHQCVSACTSLTFFSGLHIITCGSPFLSLHSVLLVAVQCFECIRLHFLSLFRAPLSKVIIFFLFT